MREDSGDEIKFVANVRRWGHSLVIVIPSRVARKSGIREGDVVVVKVVRLEV